MVWCEVSASTETDVKIGRLILAGNVSRVHTSLRVANVVILIALRVICALSANIIRERTLIKLRGWGDLVSVTI